jgi:hypothetical protein
MRMSCLVLLGLLVAAGNGATQPSPPAPRPEPPWQAFLEAGAPDKARSEAALATIAADWHDGLAGMVIDVARFLPSPRAARAAAGGEASAAAPADADDAEGSDTAPGRSGDFPPVIRLSPGADTRQRLTSFLQKQTGKRFGDDLRAWRRWVWALPPAPHAELARFKAELYARIDPRFRRFFPADVIADIRLDEIDWGGVGVNGIPPLRQPTTLPAAAASYLKDNHIVFGIEVNGEARAYPKRILAWHEMAVDRLGGVDLTLVYCTLCGTVIPFESRISGRPFTFGTSGLLYRSNKLMFDEETGSLWSALDGVPVVGSLVGRGLRLPFHAVVTTTWGEWKRTFPQTTVLSLDTGHDRDYGEGIAYREYFNTDRTMFETPVVDKRLRNKAEVLVLRREVLGANQAPVAIDVDRLKRTPVYPVDAGDRRLIVVTSRAGANRVYERGAYTFQAGVDEATLRDTTGGRWTVTPQALVSDTGVSLALVAAHRAFWFGWIAQYPDTVLLK